MSRVAESSERVASVAAARAVSDAVRSLPDVAGLYSGSVGEIATYGVGERVGGVRVGTARPRPDVDVHVVAVFGRALADIGSEVRDTVFEILRALGSDLEPSLVDVHIHDVVRQADT